MRAKGPIRVLVLLLAVSLLPVLTVSAHHGPRVGDVVAEAGVVTPPMTCKTAGNQQDCLAAERLLNHQGTIMPATGPLASVTTKANAIVVPGTNLLIYAMSAADQSWNTALHDVGCDDPNGIGSFMADLGKGSTAQKTIQLSDVECRITGSLIAPSANGGAWYYQVTSTILAAARPTPTPTAMPTPTPTPRPTATPKPTATPTARPTATPTATARPTVRPTAIATLTAGATPPLRSASESAIGSASATQTAVNTPEESVLGFTFTAEPSSAPPAPAGGGGNDWAGSVPSANQVSTDGVKVAGSALAALLLLLAMGFIGELFNDTFEGNYDRILAWWQKSWLGRIGRAFGGLWGGGK
jgi:hypothetical protein